LSNHQTGSSMDIPHCSYYDGDRDMNEAREALLFMLAQAYEHKLDGFTLSSGATSSEYIDCRKALSVPPSVVMTGVLLLPMINDGVSAIGGLTMGADPISFSVSCCSSLSFFNNRRGALSWFSIRKQQKGHGQRKMIEGNIYAGQCVAIVDDVATTGSSTIEAFQKASEFGLNVMQIIVLVDREQGGIENIMRAVPGNIPVKAVFTMSEIHRKWEEFVVKPKQS